ncbi:uncharacterized protein LOC107884353 isoform X2 [Acyrthosiphon pisum]|uniref:Uncharacterized protein n=1 Tax=Acyrthosiphon pisum TaxID=7029 RepID=A0A8R2H8X8_ACYPI|nr:uncharacterized protein LOC107884353 isoform X2 [Acyrthosiphon pisum]|eukprot:XP_016661698.1 PREDICTED: uncharacterized protein LOC107884353 isoform X2 [Acyrthosiphon pisum]
MSRKLSGCAYRKLSKIKKDSIKKSMKNNIKLGVMFQGVQQIGTVHTVHTVYSEIIDNIGRSSNNELHDRNECFESQTTNEVNILHTPSSSDMPDDDPALWILNEVTRDFIYRNGFKQNLDCDFSQSKTQYQFIRQGKFRPHNRLETSK